MAQQYRLILKDGKVQIELLGCTGSLCDLNAEKIRETLGLGAPVATEHKPEYAQPAGTDTNVFAETG